MQLIYIAGLAHSGSTVLNLCLGSHPRLVGLAEIHWMTQFNEVQLRDEAGQICTCGQRAGQCAFWGPVFNEMLANVDADPQARYQIIFRHFLRHFGPDAVLVDSSKGWPALQCLTQIPGLDIHVLFLIRDVRAFIFSHQKALPQELKMKRLRPITGAARVDSWLYRLTIKQPLYLAWKWYLRNRQLERRLAASGLPTHTVSYEHFAQQPQQALEEICAFLGIDYTAEMLVPGAGESHNFLGNQMMFLDEKKASIQYDDRWTQRREWRLAYALSPHIAHYNQQRVYPQL